MNAERARDFLLSLPHVEETAQWGGIVFWVGNKAIGGKMFLMMNPDASGELPLSFPVGQERFNDLLETEGLRPAPYMARIFWVAAERWDVFRDREWQEHFTHAHAITFDKLPPKVKSTLALPRAELKRTIAARRTLLAAKAAAKKTAKP